MNPLIHALSEQTQAVTIKQPDLQLTYEKMTGHNKYNFNKHKTIAIYLFLCFFCFSFSFWFWYFKTGFLYVTLAAPELTL